MTKTINEKLKALKQEYSVELLDRTRAGQSKQLSDFLENHLKGNATVLLDEKINKLQQRLEQDIFVISSYGGAKTRLDESHACSAVKASSVLVGAKLQEKCKILDNHLKYQRLIFDELQSITEETIHRKYALVEAQMWNQYYKELISAQQSVPAFDDTFLDEEDGDCCDIIDDLKQEEEIQEMLKITYASIKNVEELRLRDEMDKLSSALQKELDEFIADVDNELELVFKNIDSVSLASQHITARNFEASEIISQIDEVNADLKGLSDQLESGLVISSVSASISNMHIPLLVCHGKDTAFR